MAHQHSVYDTDNHFIIDGVTRAVKNASQTKTMLVQNDHNSERFTFEINKRYIDGHDLSLCNRVQVHYINIDSKTAKEEEPLVYTGVCEVDDIQVSPEDENTVICSWLISRNATRLVGSLNFMIRFACVSDDGFVDYAWNTLPHIGVFISAGINADEAFEEDYVDVIEQWKEYVLQIFEGKTDIIAEEMKQDVTAWKVTETENVRKEMTAFGEQWNSILDVERDRIDALIAMKGTGDLTVYEYKGGRCTVIINYNGVAARLYFKYYDPDPLVVTASRCMADIPNHLAPIAIKRFQVADGIWVALYPNNDLTPGRITVWVENKTSEIFTGTFECEFEYTLATVTIPELNDIRVGLDGKIYDSAGTAIREQLKKRGNLVTGSGEPLPDIVIEPLGTIYIDTDTGNMYECILGQDDVLNWRFLGDDSDNQFAVLYTEQALEESQQAQARQNIGAISPEEAKNLNCVKYIHSEQSNPVALRDLETGPCVLNGIFAYFLPATRLVKFDPPQMAMVQKFDDHTEIMAFMPKGNRINHLWVDDKSNTLTAVKLSEVESIANRVTEINETADDSHYPTAKAVLDYVKNNGSAVVEDDAVTDEKYFEIDDYGLVSLKAAYRADGAQNAELPETIIIPDVINGTAVTALQDSMFESNKRVKSITIPSLITTIPKSFASQAINLTEVNGTENVGVICEAAFRECGIKKALFPNLKSFDGVEQFKNSANLVIVDIGNTVTNIPYKCFLKCESLSAIRGGAGVTAVGERGMAGLWSLLTAPFISNLASIGKEGFLYSRVNYDWWNLQGCSVDENATPAKYNPTKWWEGENITPIPCENPLRSTFHQTNPEWKSRQILNSSDTYGSGCLETSAAHIYSALTGEELSSPVEFVEDIVGGIDNGRLLTPTGYDNSGDDIGPEYSFNDVVKWLNELGLNAERLSGGWGSENLQKVYNALAEGALVLTYIHPGHAAVIYGVTSNGEVMVLESSSPQAYLENYVAVRHRMKICNLTIQGERVMIVKK